MKKSYVSLWPILVFLGLVTLLILVTLTAPRPARADGGNLVLNPGFESGSGYYATNWSTQAGSFRTSNNPYNGDYSMEIYGNNATSYNATQNGFALEAETTYYFAVAIFRLDDGPRSAQVIDDDLGTALVELDAAEIGQWEYLTGSFSSGEVAYADVILNSQYADQQYSAWFDAVCLSTVEADCADPGVNTPTPTPTVTLTPTPAVTITDTLTPSATVLYNFSREVTLGDVYTITTQVILAVLILAVLSVLALLTIINPHRGAAK
jgi:hypothetical protein